MSSTWNYHDLYWSARADGAGAPWATRRFRIEPVVTGVYTLYNELNFTGQVFTSSQTLASLSAQGFGDWGKSLKVDADVGIVACTEASFRGECGRALGPAQIANLNSLAPGLNGGLNSIRACGGPCPPGPITPTLTSPISGQVVLSGTIVTLRWQGAGDEYFGELSGGRLAQMLTFGWSADVQKIVGVLPMSDQPYVWRVRAGNGFGTGAWAQTQFTITPASAVFLPLALRP
jgi:hypothetical protein